MADFGMSHVARIEDGLRTKQGCAQNCHRKSRKERNACSLLQNVDDKVRLSSKKFGNIRLVCQTLCHRTPYPAFGLSIIEYWVPAQLGIGFALLREEPGFTTTRSHDSVEKFGWCVGGWVKGVSDDSKPPTATSPSIRKALPQ